MRRRPTEMCVKRKNQSDNRSKQVYAATITGLCGQQTVLAGQKKGSLTKRNVRVKKSWNVIMK